MASATARLIQKILSLFRQEVATVGMKQESVVAEQNTFMAGSSLINTTANTPSNTVSTLSDPCLMVKTVRPHVRSIKFPDRKASLDAASDVTFAHGPAASPTPRPVSSATSIGSTPRGSVIEDLDLPLKYRRRPLDQIEIEYIERGGPP